MQSGTTTPYEEERDAALRKTLTIRDEVYDKLTAVKGKEESFSELFDRLVDL
jgi:hypothetical protein